MLKNALAAARQNSQRRRSRSKSRERSRSKSRERSKSRDRSTRRGLFSSGSSVRSSKSNSTRGTRRGWTRVVPPSADASLASHSEVSETLENLVIDTGSQATRTTVPASNGGPVNRQASAAHSYKSDPPSVSGTASVASGSITGQSVLSGQGTQKSAHVTSALLNAMDSEKFIDITLLGREGVRVPATKFVLASRCDGLQKMLYQDLTSLEVKLGEYGEETLTAMKEFCHSGDLTQTVFYLQTHKKNELTVKTFVELCDLANLYNFPSLYENSMQLLLPILESSPWFMAAAYDAAASPASTKIEQYALRFLEGREVDLMLETNAMKYIRPERIEKFLFSLEIDSIAKIQLLQKWLEKHGAHKPKNRRIVDSFCSSLRLEDLLIEENNIPIIQEFGYWDEEDVERLIALRFGPPQEHGIEVMQFQPGLDFASSQKHMFMTGENSQEHPE